MIMITKRFPWRTKSNGRRICSPSPVSSFPNGTSDSQFPSQRNGAEAERIYGEVNNNPASRPWYCQSWLHGRCARWKGARWAPLVAGWALEDVLSWDPGRGLPIGRIDLPSAVQVDGTAFPPILRDDEN